MLLLSQIVLFLFVHTGFAVQTVQVTTPLGDVLGSTLTTRLGKTIYSFRGIRYAQPPINDLRFKPPVPVEKWSGIYNATSDGPYCPQPTRDSRLISEDCLMLNVYTTLLSDGGNKPKRPVIIYLHAGGYYSVTGRSDIEGPQYFLDQDVVLVTLNYRLASLGFISLGRDAPGNNGLKDQVLAIKWVKSNIEAFGGDADSVTLYGYSAGAISITLHMVSPMSCGLFHKAIIGSGSALGQWPLPKNQIKLAQKQARLVGCPDRKPNEILNCLKKVPAEELGNSFPQFKEFANDPILIWAPVIEEDFGQERFLTEHPIKSIESGNFAKIPVVLGVTKEEFSYRAFDLVANATLLKELDDHFDEYAPISFDYVRNTEKSKEVSKAVRQFYLDNEPLTNASFSGLGKVYADSVIGFSVNRAADLISEMSDKPVYYYEFTYQGRYSHYYLPGTTTPYGVVHHDDLIYTFYISTLVPFFNQSFPEAEMVETLTTLWASFAKDGNPVPKSNSNFAGVKWDTYNVNSKKYLEIGKELVLREKLYEDRYAFWRNLYPISSYL